jgi:hypothetical protein
MTQLHTAESSEGRTKTPGSLWTEPTGRASRDAGCSYHEVSHVGFWARGILDLRVVQDSLAHRGLAGTLRKSAERLNLVAPATATATSAVALEAEHAASALGLQPGEWVEVKSAEEIRDTLDRRGMVRGLHFMDEMWRHTGRRFKVLKRMERLMVERTGVMRTIKNTVLLEGTVCDGSAHEGCDATCQHMWREVWLRRVEEPEADAGGSASSLLPGSASS